RPGSCAVALARVRELTYRYAGADRPALDSGSLDLRAGEVVFLLGPSGGVELPPRGRRPAGPRLGGARPPSRRGRLPPRPLGWREVDASARARRARPALPRGRSLRERRGQIRRAHL